MGKRKKHKTDRHRASKKESSLNKPSNSLTNLISFWGSISSITGISMITIAGVIIFIITILLFPSEKLYIIPPPSKNIPVFKGVHFPTLADMENHIHPDSRDNLIYYLKNRNKKGNVKRNAIECLKIVLENEKNNDNKIKSILHTSEAASYLEDGDLSKTIEILEMALSLDPDNLFALYYTQIVCEKSLDNLLEKNHSSQLNPQELLDKIKILHFKIKDIKNRINELDNFKNDREAYNNTFIITLDNSNSINIARADAGRNIDILIEEVNSQKLPESGFPAGFFTYNLGSKYFLDDTLIKNTGNVSSIYDNALVLYALSNAYAAGELKDSTKNNIASIENNADRYTAFKANPLKWIGVYWKTLHVNGEMVPETFDLRGTTSLSFWARGDRSLLNDGYYMNVTDSRLRNAYSANNSLLAVGIDSYENNSVWNSLDFAVSDTKKVAEAFARYGFKPTLLTNEEGSKLNILKHLVYESLISKPEDTFIFYISGHGFSDINENKFILTYNKNRDLSDILSLKEIEASLGTHKGKVLIITDTCYNKLYIDLKNHPSSKIKKIGSNHPVFLLASALGERSIESHKLGSSLATYALLEFLNRSNIYSRKEYLDLNKMFAFVSTRTSALAQSIYGLNQNPILLHEGREYKISLDKGLSLVHSKR